MRRYIHLFFDPTIKIKYLVRAGFLFGRYGFIGKFISVLIDKVVYFVYAMEVCSRFVDVKDLQVGHSVGVVLGGTGIRCTGTLRVASGVVFGVDINGDTKIRRPAFSVIGDLTVGANAVIIGPTQFTGSVTIGALSFLKLSEVRTGVYVGNPVRRLTDDINDQRDSLAQ